MSRISLWKLATVELEVSIRAHALLVSLWIE